MLNGVPILADGSEHEVPTTLQRRNGALRGVTMRADSSELELLVLIPEGLRKCDEISNLEKHASFCPYERS